MGSTPDPGARAGSRWRKLLRWALRLALALVALAALWLGAHLLLRGARGPVLWTEADLPPLRPAEDNGWSMIQAKLDARPVPRPSDDLRRALQDDRADDARRWAAFDAHQADIDDFLDDDATREWLAIYAAARARPHFADACPIDLDARCRHVDVLWLHEAAELDAARRAQRGAFAEALSGGADLLRVDLALLGSSRSILAHHVAIDAVRRSLAFLGAALHGHGLALASGKAEALPQDARASIRAQIARVRPEDIHIERGVRSEYVFFVRTLDLVVSGAAGDGLADGPLARVLLDEGRTLAIANRHFEEAMACARAPACAAPALEPASRGFGWWLYNPVGKLLLDTRMDTAAAVRGFRGRAQAVVALRDALLARLDAPG